MRVLPILSSLWRWVLFLGSRARLAAISCFSSCDQLLQLVLAHVAADVLGHTIHQPNHLYVHAGSPGPEETSVVQVDELFALLAFEEVEASFVAHVRVPLQMGGGAGLLWVVEAAASPPVLATRGRVVVFLQSEDQGSQFVVFAGLWNVAGDEPVDESKAGACLFPSVVSRLGASFTHHRLTVKTGVLTEQGVLS